MYEIYDFVTILERGYAINQLLLYVNSEIPIVRFIAYHVLMVDNIDDIDIKRFWE
jgi:hypothetical protein